MNKKKSVVLLSVIAVVMVVLTVLTFARFRIPAYKNGTKIYDSFLGAIALDQDLEGGVAYELTLIEDISEENEEIDVNDVINTLQLRLSALGYENAVVKAFRESDTDAYSFRVEMKKTDSAEDDIKVVAAYGELEFVDGHGTYIMGSEGVKSAKYVYDSASSAHYVQLTFTKAGLNAIEEAMHAESEDEHDHAFTLAINLGDNQLFSSTLEESYIQQNSIYITNGTAEAAKQLALQISSGGLKYEFERSEQMTVAPTLGENAQSVIFVATALAVLVIFIALMVIYGGFGFVSAITVYAFLLVEILMMILVPGITLNIGGVVGIIAAIIFTVDSMVKIMNKTKAEYANGKTLKASVKTAYKKSIFSILETAGIFAALSLLVFFICSGTIKCFAITFGIGVVIAAVATMFFSQLMCAIFLPLLKDKSEKFFNLKRQEVAE